jgi:hypothetical protein
MSTVVKHPVYETTLCHVPEDSPACKPPILLSFWHYAITSHVRMYLNTCLPDNMTSFSYTNTFINPSSLIQRGLNFLPRHYLNMPPACKKLTTYVELQLGYTMHECTSVHQTSLKG